MQMQEKAVTSIKTLTILMNNFKELIKSLSMEKEGDVEQDR